MSNKVFGSKSIRKAVYDAMVNGIDCGPFDGGCVTFAMALQKVHGGEVYAIVGKTAQGPFSPLTISMAQHAILKRPDGLFMDASGIGKASKLASTLSKEECFGRLVYEEVRPLLLGDLPEAPRDQNLSEKIAEILESSLAEA